MLVGRLRRLSLAHRAAQRALPDRRAHALLVTRRVPLDLHNLQRANRLGYYKDGNDQARSDMNFPVRVLGLALVMFVQLLEGSAVFLSEPSENVPGAQ